ncbi:HAMP domain protein [Collimonas fungivorans]|uniref:Signal transduction histidine-protein kinase/phosphatase MprB n=1 Tax=Collimonas fungivorans TaxID=158899 RepID=A0A127P6L0_9BURK|nr:sensor histidine kinase efflux regulator BaeS [Collimonas fungivorans]AMO93285.1 HAMP domain protein [Collimonas fungivorans]
MKIRISITVKLFLSVLTACTAVLLVQTVTVRISFQRDFLDYLNGQGSHSMEKILPRLTVAYKEHGSWEFFHTDSMAWLDLIRPQGDFDEINRNLSIADQTGALMRTGLLDTHLQRIAGNLRVDANSIRRPVIVDGQTVGWIAMAPFQEMMSTNDERFLEKQRKVWIVIGFTSLAVIAILTFFLTRALLDRVRGLVRATHRLAAGDYASRIEVGSLDELGALAQDFNRMAHALEHNERARRTFMADISHELRTPLAVIRAELEAIQDGIRLPNTQSFDAMHREIGQLGKLIDDLHDLALTDIGALAYRRLPIDLTTILKTALASMQGRFNAKDLHLETHLTPEALIVIGDERRLQQLFANLLENTLRYTDNGGQINVSCTHTDGLVMIIFEDSAPGVPEDKLNHLFDRFYRVEASRNRASGGSGLGLAICRNIAEAHNGHISATASPLGGLRISIELTLAVL